MRAVTISCSVRSITKGLNIAIEPPPGGLLSAKFHAINPVGTIPCLILENNTPLPESAAIMEYLEDKFPEPPLRPAGPEARAWVRLLQRIRELQIIPAGRTLPAGLSRASRCGYGRVADKARAWIVVGADLRW
jgi:glutathione S-transferase